MLPSERLTLARGAYGRGYYDAMKKVNDMAASQRKVSEMERNLNSEQSKVYECVPIVEKWSTGQVIAEARRNGKALDLRSCTGVLNSLKGLGLILEIDIGYWQRIPLRAEQPAEVPAVKLVQQVIKAPPAPAVKFPATVFGKVATPRTVDGDTLGNMARLARDVRDCAKEMEALASSLDDLAIEVEERIQRINADSQKLNQLRALLKGIED